MPVSSIVSLVQNAVFQVLLMAAPVLLIGMGVGLIVSIFQATTSIQEQTLTFIPKILAVVFTLIFLGPWMAQILMQYTENLFLDLPWLFLPG